MTFKWDIEETVSGGLDKLQAQFEEDMKYILNELAYEATGRYEERNAPIPKMMGYWNPNLYMSGQEDEHRFFEPTENGAEFIIQYTGMTEFSEEMYVWFEFGGFSSAQTTTLERDYSYYQETGKDPIAKPSDAKHTHAVEWGLLYAYPDIRRELRRQLGLMLNRTK